MSYDVWLTDPHTHEVMHAKDLHFFKGGTYCADGTTELWLNITYNYAKILAQVLGDSGIRALDGMNASTSIFVLEGAIDELDDDIDENYWKPTEGNVKNALRQLLVMAKIGSQGIWRVS